MPKNYRCVHCGKESPLPPPSRPRTVSLTESSGPSRESVLVVACVNCGKESKVRVPRP